MRAYLTTLYPRPVLAYEKGLEAEAKEILAKASHWGDKAMKRSLQTH